jgi:hypothetical protein
MKTLIHRGLAVVAVFALCAGAQGDSLYVIDLSALGARLPDSACGALIWTADTVFYNLTATDLTVHLLGVSNGGLPSGIPDSFVVPAGQAASIRQKTTWQPGSHDPLWVYHLDVPSGLSVDSELFIGVTNAFCPVPVVVNQQYGKARMPVLTSLVPAGQQQVLTGLTLGDVDGHINVGIYNGGSDVASSVIEIRRACDGALVDTRRVTVAPDVMQQFGSLLAATAPVDCTLAFNGPNGLNRLAYAVVTVSQPSLTYAAVVANGQLPSSGVQVSASQSP